MEDINTKSELDEFIKELELEHGELLDWLKDT